MAHNKIPKKKKPKTLQRERIQQERLQTNQIVNFWRTPTVSSVDVNSAINPGTGGPSST